MTPSILYIDGYRYAYHIISIEILAPRKQLNDQRVIQRNNIDKERPHSKIDSALLWFTFRPLNPANPKTDTQPDTKHTDRLKPKQTNQKWNEWGARSAWRKQYNRKKTSWNKRQRISRSLHTNTHAHPHKTCSMHTDIEQNFRLK